MEEKKVLQKRINIDNNKQKAMNKKLKNRINYERPQIHENKKVDEMIYRKFGKFVLLKRQNLHKNEILNETDLGGRFPKKDKNINQKGLNLINKENPKKYKIRTKSAEIEKKKDDKNIINNKKNSNNIINNINNNNIFNNNIYSNDINNNINNDIINNNRINNIINNNINSNHLNNYNINSNNIINNNINNNNIINNIEEEKKNLQKTRK